MPLPRRVAELNRSVTNPLARLIAGRVPPFGIIEHRGRRSGRRYRTPVMGWFAGDEYIIALTYGPSAEWLKNLQAAGAGELVAGSRTYRLEAPRIERGIQRAPGIPWPIRRFLRLVRIDHYLRLRAVPETVERRADP